MGVEVRAEHYSAEDRRLLIAAGDALVAWAADLARHEAMTSDGRSRWYRTEGDDPVLTAGQLGWLVASTTATLRQVVGWYTDTTLAAYSRAIRDGEGR